MTVAPKKFVGTVSVVAVLSALSACFNNPPVNPAELTFTWREPKRSDVVGVWVPTADTLKDMQRRGHYAISRHELTLREDGTFSMLNMPDWWSDDSGESHRGFESGSGFWRITESDGWCVSLHFKTPAGRLDFGTSLHLRHQKPPYLIHVYLGDPDGWKAMLLQRIR